jgi:hypothetical protein
MTPDRPRAIFAEELDAIGEPRLAERVRGGADVDPTIRAALKAMTRVANEAARHDILTFMQRQQQT